MVAILRTLVALATLASLALSVPVHTSRSSKITFIVTNRCKHSFAPIFLPALPGKPSWSTLKHGKTERYSFFSDDYRGKVFSPLRQANTTTGEGATQGELDLYSGDYDISVANGFNVGMYMQLLGQQEEGYCQAAICGSKTCKDAYHKESGLMTASRKGDDTVKPNHSCPPTFSTWNIQFC
ncbi:Thaumatin [Kalmanozyma brasiliensis GHG001]|uniref:Osmotin, thaumatin-like protein n=1 Tax=Kalmanozyma brasiliensis (strain GHG001) TaxID=1365824 RepID=V5GQ35_KALBG|nr:Thaumatin [Kalmanozyma brasiliensis GHG001]EST08037.1 Thaumatin [Kalmanozyma brasiliensis GHG001]